MKLLKKLYQILESRKRRREVTKIRRKSARAGYPLDQFRDSQIEAALRRNTDVGVINAKTIYRTVKRLRVTPGEQDRTLSIRGVTHWLLWAFSISRSPAKEIQKLNAYWPAANYLSVGQIYLYANSLLREPLKLDHVKPRLVGHCGTTPGLNFMYAHLIG